MNDEIADDATLLRQYADGSEPAFRELVRRHLGMVHATARRILSMAPHLADDVTQNVFTDLAKKAATLPAGTVLGGWLHRHTCYLALNAARAEHRRHARERTAMEMNALHENPGADAQWLQLAPVLDDALDHLNPEDRDAIVLRYLEQRDLRSIGAALGVSDDTAQKRVARALEKLRAFLAGRGVTLSSTLLTATLDAGAIGVPVSPDLATTISSTSLSKATAATVPLNSLKTIITSRLTIGAAVILASVVLILFFIMQNGSSVSPAATSAPTAKATAAALAPTPASIPVISATKVEAPKAAPADSIALTDNMTEQDSFGPVSPTDAIAPSPSTVSQTAPAAGPAAAAAPASEVPGSSPSGYADGSTRMPTVTNGQLMMTTTYADGTVSTVPYKEAGATVTITPGDKPNTYVLTFRGEDNGRIYSIIHGVPGSPDDSTTPAK